MTAIEEFKKEVHEGLSSQPKQLSSKYFYDEKGDDLFVQITQLPEYYLTRAENEIFLNQREAIIDALDIGNSAIEVIELGAGDGHKAVQLLEPLKAHAKLTFIPIDISKNALASVEERFMEELPEIDIRSAQGDYFTAIKDLASTNKKIILFLGSNIGNFSDAQATTFMSRLSQSMEYGDKLLLGVDLKKSPEIILPAYNDKTGVTHAFNMNLLNRINRELAGEFDLTNFEHVAEYDMIKGEARSYLRSKTKQDVYIAGTNSTYSFNENEKIQTEISQKYDEQKLNNIVSKSELSIIAVFKDGNSYFADFLLEKRRNSN